MPHARTCLDCNTLIPYSQGTRCQPCSDKHGTEHNRRNAYYRTKEWRKLRDLVVANGCMICGRTQHETRMIAHHIKPRKDGGLDTFDNLAPLCHHHHNQVEGHIRSGRRSQLVARVEQYHNF